MQECVHSGFDASPAATLGILTYRSATYEIVIERDAATVVPTRTAIPEKFQG
jgi:hypothetical protein